MSCAFPEVDRLGKACEGSCDPYFCVERVCVAAPPDGGLLPVDASADAPKDADAADGSVPGPCVPKPLLDGGTIVFRDCFDDRDEAVGLGTPWPSSDVVALDRSAQVSSPSSLLFRSGGTPKRANSGPLRRGASPAAQLACTFYVRFDSLVASMDFFEVKTILVGPANTPGVDESVALRATPLGQGVTWRPRYYISQPDGGAPAVSDMVLTSPRTAWTKVSTVLKPGSIVIRVGDSTQTVIPRTASAIAEFSVHLGVLIQEGSTDEVIRYDDVICDVTTTP